MLRAADSRGARQRDRGGHWRTILFVALVSIGAPDAMGAPPLAPAKGRMLIAGRAIADPNFSHSVILLLEYSADGALGVIVNRPAGIPPSALLPDLSALSRYDGSIYLGGPVGVEMLLLLVRGCDRVEDAETVYGDVCYSGSAKALAELARDGAKRRRLRMYVGYAGWGAGQLDREIARGDWHVAEARDERVFSEDPQTLWEHLAPAPEPIETRVAPPDLPAIVLAATSTDRSSRRPPDPSRASAPRR
jgi:putative transcriptional regulator